MEEANAALGSADQPAEASEKLGTMTQANAALGEPAKERYQTWPERLGRGVYKAGKEFFTAPGEAYQGKLDPLSDEAIGRMTEGAALASPLSRGTLVTRGAAPAIEEAVAAGARQNIPIPRFMTGETSVMPRVAESLRAAPIAGVPIERAAEGLRSGLGEAIDRLAPETSQGVAGEAAKEAIQGSIKARPGIGDAFNEIDALITNPGAKVPLSRAEEVLGKINASRAESNLPTSPLGKFIRPEEPLVPGTPEWWASSPGTVAKEPGFTYPGVKGLRSFIGEKSPQQLVAEGLSPSETKRIYGALTEDLRTAAHAAGGERAVEAWESANALARQGIQERKALYKIVGAKGDASPELVYSKLSAMAGSNSRADIGKLTLAKKTMGPEAWDQFASARITQMGRDAQGEFSSARFMTQYAKTSPAAREIIFNPEQKNALNDIQLVSKLVQDKASKFANVSKTAHTAAGLAAVVGMILHPMTLMKELGGGLAMSWWLTRPAVVKAAADAGRASLRNPIERERALRFFNAAVVGEMEGRKPKKKATGGRTMGRHLPLAAVSNGPPSAARSINGPANFKKGGRVTRDFVYGTGGAVYVGVSGGSFRRLFGGAVR